MLHPIAGTADAADLTPRDGIVLGIVLLLIVLCVVVLLLDKLTGQDHQVKFDRWLDARITQYKRRRKKRREKRDKRSPSPSDEEAKRTERRASIERARIFVAGQADWPSTRWELTAPECYQLRYAGNGHAHMTFKLAVKELIGARALRISPVRLDGRRWWGKEPAALTAEPYAGITAESPLAPVFGVFSRATKQRLQGPDDLTAGTRSVEGVLMKDFVRAAFKELDRFYGYSHHVCGALIARGLLTPFGWTDTGREAADELEEWLLTGRERLGDWVSEEPQLAFAYTSGAGATILLMDDIYPEFALLDQHLVPYAWGR